MIRSIFLFFVLASAFLGLLFSAFLSWNSDYLSVEISNDEGLLFDVKRHSNSPPNLVTEPLKKMLQRGASEPNIDPNSFLRILELYLQRSPLDASAWLYGSQFYQRVGDKESASLYLSVAHRLSETNTPVLFKVFNRYLEMGLVDQSISVAHDIVIVKPGEFRRLFYLMGRLSNDYPRLVDELIPKDIKSSELIEKGFSSENNFYYNWALIDAIRSKNTLLANEVWLITPSGQKNSSLGVKYLDYLAGLQQVDLLKKTWSEVVLSDVIEGYVLNQGDDESSPCWNIKETDNAELSVISNERISTALKVKFLGKENVNFNHMSCLVLVQPSKQYELTGRYKTNNISTLSGPYVDVHFPGIKEGYRRVDDVIGNSSWTSFKLVFDVPNNAHIARIRIRRNKTKLLDSKISGTVWFDSMELSKLEVNEDLFE